MAKKRKCKKAEISFLGMHISNLIIAVVCIIILLVIGSKIYGMFTEKSDLEKAEKNLKVITERLQMLKDTPGVNSAELLVYLPSNWLLRSYAVDFPDAECYSRQSCLCICQNPTCANNIPKVCNGLDFLVEVPASYEVSQSWYEVWKYFSTATVYPNTIMFEKSVEGLKLSKSDSNGKILIEKMTASNN